MMESQQILKSIDEKNVVILPFSLIHSNCELHLGLNVQKVASVVEVGDYSLLPGVSAPFLYMIKIQGIPVPVIEINQLNNLNELNNYQLKNCDKIKYVKKRIIICHVLTIYIGIVVDITKKIKTISNKELLPPPDIWENDKHFFVSAMINEKEKYRYIFDIEKYIASIGISIGNVAQDFKSNSDNIKVLKGKTGLVVEDSRVYQALAKQFFEKYEMHMELAKDGKQGLEMLLANAENYDFVISDIEMPNMNGIQMIKEFKSIKKVNTTPILFHSSISNPEFSKDLQEEGLGLFIHKFNEENLIKTILSFFK
ncbi:chemotaxis protein CheV [Silvanigrella aquatica]|uniref:Response regulatory domain-containing protein n=1 Tax=Silvanigrella aquatica TaxID=1915309 RepID=A0A1L4D1C9_9BACT|nr:response regulator [Silvanigrella aquatica]APJ03998.1 hypothetical protein AXG55_08800 [Silvanigrella aquatica]